MTVCIAGRTAIDGTIVCATDMMISMSDLSMSADSATLKIGYVGKKWAMMAAGDLSCYADVKRHLLEYFQKHNTSIDKLSRPELSDALKYAFEKEIRIRAEAEILSPYGLTFDNYRDEGPKLGSDTFSRILFALQEKDLGLNLLLAGFGEKGNGHIFTVEKRGLSQHFDGAWAIGSGDLGALGYLFSSQLSVMDSAEELFYHVCCAKFAAETSPGVGKRTVIAVLKKDGSRKFADEEAIEDIRKEWERRRKSKISDARLVKIKKTLDAIKPDQPSDVQKSGGQP